jgi:hypothetical protein
VLIVICVYYFVQSLPNSGKLVEQGKSMLEDNLGFSTEKSTQDVGNYVVSAEEGEDFPHNRRLDLELNLRPTKK